MRILLDTHVWIWSQVSANQLGTKAESYLKDPDNELFVSPISTLEIARLIQLGRVDLSIRLEEWLKRSFEYLLCQTIVLSHEIAELAYNIPEPFHRDPADRILVATCLKHELTMATADERILVYPHIKTIDARK